MYKTVLRSLGIGVSDRANKRTILFSNNKPLNRPLVPKIQKRLIILKLKSAWNHFSKG